MSQDLRAGELAERDLLGMRRRALAALWARNATATPPDGRGAGTVLAGTGPRTAGPLARVVRRLAWQGKVFDRRRGDLRNMLTPFGVLAVRARVGPGRSVLDGRDCVVLDYSGTSKVAWWVRDEIREVAPGLWLGVALVRGHPVAWFALRFPAALVR